LSYNVSFSSKKKLLLFAIEEGLNNLRDKAG